MCAFSYICNLLWNNIHSIGIALGETNFEIKDKYAYFCQLIFISFLSLKLHYLLLNCNIKIFIVFYERVKIKCFFFLNYISKWKVLWEYYLKIKSPQKRKTVPIQWNRSFYEKLSYSTHSWRASILSCLIYKWKTDF